jgi:ABC-type sugar transport system permease subunit
MYEAYNSAFRFGDRPRSAVIVTVLLVCIAAICLIQFKFLNENNDDESIKGR